MSFFFADNNFSSVNIKLSESLLNIREIIRLIGLEIKIRPYLINHFYPWHPINIFSAFKCRKVTVKYSQKKMNPNIH